jgi:DHA1 family multidrug resistance protein-like MFS transporter
MSPRFVHYSIAFLMQFFISIGTLSVPLLATRLQASNLELGLIGTLGAATYTFTVIIAGGLSDKLGRKRVLIAGAILTALTYAAMPASRSPLHLIFFMGLSGCGMAFFWPVLEAWMSDTGDHEDIRKGLGGFNVSWSAGGCLGPLIGGLIYTRSSTLAFMCAAAGSCLVAYLAFLHKHKSNEMPVATSMAPQDDDTVRISQSVLYGIWMANFASWFAIAEIRILFPKLAVSKLGMQPWVIGNLIFALGLALTVMFYVMGRSTRWHGATRPLMHSQILIVLLLLMLTVSDSALALGLLFAGLGAAFGVTYSYSLYYSIIGSQRKGTASGRHEMVLGMGALLGPFMGGGLAEILQSQRAPYALGAALVLISLIVQVRMYSSGVRS